MTLYFLLTLLCVEPQHIILVQSKPIIAIQPLGKIDTTIVNKVKDGIGEIYNVDLVILPEMAIPLIAYYKPRNRYRAEKILIYLNDSLPGKYTKIIGLTDLDISTTKGNYYDWGIFGLGSLGRRTCLVSSYRLKKGNVTKALFYERVIKVVNHELGHTFGLIHCPVDRCLMADVKGSVKIVDNETGNFCPECARKLETLLKPR